MSVTLTQRGVILALLRIRPQGITPLDAMNELGCMRLGARIYDLRRDGHDIRTTYETRNGKTYARYQLVPIPRPVSELERRAMVPRPPLSETEQRMMWGDR